ncbi:MAG: MFS transporter [Proteobacteria bacterium]|nr:MFS transporter [Pseudomonadota bacterium]
MSAPDATADHHAPNQFALLKERRFGPFFWTQFAGAANDNVYKNALVIYAAFHATTLTTLDPNTLVNLAAAIFILPFVLLSATSGQLADKFEKSRLIRLIKLFEIGIMVVGLAGFALKSLPLLFTALALMGVHSTLFGPVKYSILPQHLSVAELTGGNGMVEMGTFVAILIGTIAGGLIVAIEPHGPVLAGATAIAIAVAGWWVSRGIPLTPPVDAGLKLNWNPFTETGRNLKLAYANRTVWLSLLGISWFWFYGATFLTQFPNFTREILGGDEHVATFLLALFSVGIGTGSLLCERLSGHRVELALVPLGSIGMTVFAVDLWFACRGLHEAVPAGVGVFLANHAHWRVIADLLLIGAFGGFYIVPLYALIQTRSDPAYRSRIIAANNILNALFLVVSAGVALGLLKAGLSIPQLFLTLGLMNAVVALFIYLLLPEFLMRFLAWIIVHAAYRVRTAGLANIPDEGAAVVVCNHVSYADAMIIAGYVRRPLRFVMDHRIFSIPVLSFIFRTMRTIPIAPAREDAVLKAQAFADVDAALAAGELVCIFPEGRLTDTGELLPFKPGIAEILARRPVPVVPMALRGLWGSCFSRAHGGKAMGGWLGLRAPVDLVAGPVIAAPDATVERLQRDVAALRGERR